MSEDVIVKEYNDGITWYKIYQSGIVEQGTKIYSATPTKDIKLPINYADTNYTVSVSNSPQAKYYKQYMKKTADVVVKNKTTNLKENQTPKYTAEILNTSEFKVNSDINSGCFEWYAKGVLGTDIYTVTINVIPSDAKVVINGIERNTFSGMAGTKVNYTVTRDDYDTVEKSVFLTSDVVIDVVMEETNAYMLTIIPGPMNATVMINGEERKSIKLSVGQVANWEVSMPNYVTETGSTTIDDNTTLNVNLSREMVVTIDAVPDDANIYYIGDK
jgi:hypothetical protein